MPVIKPDKHELFAQFVVSGMNQRQAYAEVTGKPCTAALDPIASRLASNVKVSQRIEELKARKAVKVTLNRNYVVEAAIENLEKALGRKPVKLTRGDNVEEIYLYRGEVANGALKMLGNELGLFADKKELRVVNEFDKMSNEELAEDLQRVATLLLEKPKIIDHEE